MVFTEKGETGVNRNKEEDEVKASAGVKVQIKPIIQSETLTDCHATKLETHSPLTGVWYMASLKQLVFMLFFPYKPLWNYNYWNKAFL